MCWCQTSDGFEIVGNYVGNGAFKLITESRRTQQQMLPLTTVTAWRPFHEEDFDL